MTKTKKGNIFLCIKGVLNYSSTGIAGTGPVRTRGEVAKTLCTSGISGLPGAAGEISGPLEGEGSFTSLEKAPLVKENPI